jgi:hypothetical protein
MPKPPRSSDPHAALQDALNDLLRERPFASRAEVQHFFEAEVHAYNTRPQAELGGLSPNDMSEILYGDWVRSGALTVNAALTGQDIGDSEYIHNAVALLTTLRDEGPAKATAAGNLSRDFVAGMLPRMRFRDGYLGDVRRMNRVINESDVWPLEMIRHLLLFAGLVKRHKGFRISPLGREMLDDTRRGELFALLFKTFFRQFDLRAMDRIEGQDGLQRTIAFTFWKLRSAAESWTTPARLADVAWLESAWDPPLNNPVLSDKDRRELAFSARVVQPLIGFGLLEARDVPAKNKWEHPIEVRKTPLYDRALRFRFGSSLR